jgi:hypothetical protein
MATNTSIWLATYDSANFAFKAIGSTEAEARINLLALAQRHSAQYGISVEQWFTASDAWVLEFTPDTIGYRDDFAVKRSRVGRKVTA